MDTTGSLGGLHVTGTGTAGSGGTIQHKTGTDMSRTGGIGIYLNNTSDVQLDRMQLNDFDNFAIRGNNVNGFSLANSVVNGASGNTIANITGDSYGEGAIFFGNNGGAGRIPTAVRATSASPTARSAAVARAIFPSSIAAWGWAARCT